MIEPTIPENEAERLNALKSYQILDTIPEQLYDDITQIASQVCDTPIALISMIDSDRQWFKSHQGLDVTETPRELAYCAHAINNPDEILEVTDALKDKRFQNNPLAKGEPHVRFYAGAPLTDDEGYTLGTLCVIDHKARKLNKEQKNSLWALSRQVIALLKLRKENLLRKKKDEEFTSLVENLGDGVFELDSAGRWVYINTKMLQMLQRTRDEVINTSIWDLVHEDDVQQMKNYYGIRFRNLETRCYYEYRIIPKEGEPIWVSQNTTMEYEGNQMVRLRSIARDLSENKNLKKELEERTTLYELVSENSSDLIALHDTDSTYRYVSPSCFELLGYTTEELIGRNPFDLIHPNDRAHLWNRSEKDLLNGAVVEKVEFRIQKKDGSYLWMESFAKAIKNEDGRIISFQTSSRDISEKKLERDRINRYKDGLTLLNELASSPPTEELLIEKALKCVTEYLNLSMGVLSETVDNKYFVRNVFRKDPEIHPPEEYPQTTQDTLYQFTVTDDSASTPNDAIPESELKTFIGANVYKNGQKYGTVSFADGKPRLEKFTHYECQLIELFAKWLGSVIASKEERILLQSEKAKAEAASSAKDSFLSMMSHEIRTPLNGIIGTTHLLLKKDPTEAQLAHLNVLRQSGDNLLAIVNDILDFNKIEEGKILLDDVEFDLIELTTTLHQNYLIQSEEKHIDFLLELDDGLASGYIGDSVRISQILHNLISNAIKFTDKGKVTLRVSKPKEHDAYDELLFEVIDTGIGIPPHKQKEVFEIFIQADKSTTRKYGGSGLGLAITKRLIELMESEITVESEEGKGANFFFKLTLKQTETAVKKPASTITNEVPELAGNVLLVEDNLFNRAIAKDFLSSWGCSVIEAVNGKEAIEQLADKTIDLVLLDLQMPIMDGYETIKALRDNEDPYFQKIPVIALTASAFGDTKDKVFKAGMNDFVTKPFHPKEFYSKLANHLLSQNPSENINESVNSHILDNLKEKLGEGDEQVQKYLGIFTDMLVEEYGRLEESISTRDQDQLKIYAHKNKSSLRLVGLDEMAREAEELEDMIEHNNPTDMILNRAISHRERITELLEQLQPNT